MIKDSHAIVSTKITRDELLAEIARYQREFIENVIGLDDPVVQKIYAEISETKT